MKKDEMTIEEVTRDLTFIREAIESTARRLQSGQSASARRTHLMVLIGAGILSLVFLGYELFTGGSLTADMLLTTEDREYTIFGIAQIATLLLLLCASLYTVVWRASKSEGESFVDYVARNFHYLRNISLLSDLFIKFSVLSLILLAGKAIWVASLLILFTADYLIQGRLFVLPVQAGILAGMACIAVAAWMFSMSMSGLMLPFAIFSVCAFISSMHLYRSLSGTAEEAGA